MTDQAWFRTIELSDGSYQIIYRDAIAFAKTKDQIIPTALNLRNEYRADQLDDDSPLP